MLTGGDFSDKKTRLFSLQSFSFLLCIFSHENLNLIIQTISMSVTCPKLINFVVLLLAFFKATKKSLDCFSRLLLGHREPLGSLAVESEYDSCYLFT